MDTLAVVLLSGLSVGMVYFLVATGLSMVMGLMGIVNLAHGVLFMLGGYLGLTVARLTGNFALGILAGGIAAGIVGLTIERGFLRRLYRRTFEQILVTFGFLFIITNVHVWIYGPWPQVPFVPTALAFSIRIGQFYVIAHWFAVIITGTLICLGLWWLQDKTKIGAIIRAGMDDAEMVSGLGINLSPITILAFFLGSFLAGLAGVIGSPVLGGVGLESGLDMLLVALVVCIVGGVGSIQGALVGALSLGILTALVSTYVPVMAMFVMYIVVILILLLRPSGLLGRKY